MATRNSKTANNATKSTGRRTGCPTNASRRAAVQSQYGLLIDTAMAAASAAAKAALGIIDGGVTSIGIPQGSQSQTAGQQQGNQSQSAGQQGTASKSITNRARKAPGRRVEEDSRMSQTRRFYDENLKASNPLVRADFVREAAKRFGYTKETANTYVSNIEKQGGYKLERRGGAGAARGRSRGTAKKASNQSAAASA